MNKLFLSVVSAALLCGSLCADEIEFKLEKPADWNKNSSVKWVGPEKDVMEVKGSAFLSSSKLFDVNVNKKYKLEVDGKVISGGPAWIYVGFQPYTKDGRAIPCEAVNLRVGSETTVLMAAKKGSTKLILKNNPAWKTPGIVAVALNAKKNYADLPNFNFLLCKACKIVNGNVEVTLKAPLKADIAAGTPVRGHCSGGYMYAAGFKKLANGQSFEFKGTVKGAVKTGMGRRAWAPGAAKARVIILVNWGNRNAVAQIKDVELEIEK